jgi:hypothetical protein
VPEGSQLISAQNFDEVPAEAFEKPDKHWKTDTDLASVQGDVYVEPNTGTYINREFNKTVFGNWVQVDPGEEKTVIFKYRLPFKLYLQDESGLRFFSAGAHSAFHSALIQRQAGEQNTDYSVELNLPNATVPTWLYPAAAKQTNNKINYELQGQENQLIAFVIE